MSAPVGFNPNASLLPDPGSIPIQTMKGGANITKAPVEVVGDFSPEELTELALYQLEPGGVIEHDIDSSTKKEFLKQIKDKSRCRRTTGDSIILGKDCWAIVKVTRALLKAKLNKTNSGAPLPAPLKIKVNASVGPNASTANAGVGTSQLTRQDGKRNLGTGRFREGGPENGFSNNESNAEENEFSNNESNAEENGFSNNESNGEENEDRNENQSRPSPCVRVSSRKNRSNSGSNNNRDESNSGLNGNSENQTRPSPCVRVVTRKNRSNSGENGVNNNETRMEKYERNRLRSKENNRQGRKSLGIENENEDNQNEDNNETRMEKYERNRMRNRQNNSEGRVLLGIHNENEENENENNGNSENENARNQGDVDKIEELDNWVLGNYDDKIGEKETFTYYGKKDSSYIKPLTGGQDKYNPLIKNWKTVVTVGDGHCLIHALFTSLLPSYRKIKYDDRQTVGETFRKTVFADLFEGADKKFVQGNKFLEEKHLDIFVNTYKINVFVLRNVRNGKSVTFELHTVDNQMMNEFDWIAINDTLDGHFSSILMGDNFRLTNEEFIDKYSDFFEESAKDDELQQLKRNIVKNIHNLAPNNLKNIAQAYREEVFRTNEISKLKDLIEQIESKYGLKKGDIVNKYNKRMK